MNEKDWTLLTALAAGKNLTRAAQRLYVTQPAVTRRIQQIEQELNCAIVVRGARGVELSAEGEALARYAAEELQRLQALREYIDNRGADVRGTIRLACANAYARACLPGILKEFSARCRGADVHVVTGHSAAQSRRLSAGEVHVAIVRGSFDWGEESLPLGADPYYYVVSAAPVELERLPELPQIRITTDAPLEAELHRWWMERYRRPPRVSTVVDRSDICVEMVRRGLGYSLLSGLDVQGCPDLFRERLLFASGKRELRRDTRAYCRAVSLQLRAVRAFWDFLRERSQRSED